MRYIFGFWLAVTSLFLGASQNTLNGQTQTTYGPCSPAVANVRGNISITCTMPDRRIRIARYEGPISSVLEHQKFINFIKSNFDKVVYINVHVGVLDNVIQMPDPDEPRAVAKMRFAFNPQCGFSCGGQEYHILGPGAQSAITTTHAAYVVMGYFIPKNLQSAGQGWSDDTLEFVDRQKIIFSNNFIP